MYGKQDGEYAFLYQGLKVKPESKQLLSFIKAQAGNVMNQSQIEANHIWFWFYLRLAEEMARIFSPVTEHTKSKPQETQINFNN